MNINELHPSRRLLSWITGILTFLLTLSALIVKWRIIQPIHNEIVEKHLNNQSLFYTQHSICRTIGLVSEFNILTFPFACLLIILFTIITKRVSLRRHKCTKDYIGIPIPLDFFAHVKRTLAAVIFAIFADELLEIVKGALFKDEASRDKGLSLN